MTGSQQSERPEQIIELRQMGEVRETREWAPVFIPQIGHTLRERVFTTWRDQDGRLMGSWRWA